MKPFRSQTLPRTTPPTVIGLVAVVAALAVAAAGFGQSITTPPSGANQKASVTQHIGLATVTIDYSSPDVTGPQGADRRGQIWGQLVPYGLNNLGFGPATQAPWRAGANENTVFTVSHDVLVQGRPLSAGTYGLHMIAEEAEDWTVIFSNNSTSWGSFFYDPKEDALRVKATPEKAPFREWLTYDFIDRQQDQATVAVHWEELRVPFTIEVPEMNELYFTRIKEELRTSPGFTWQAWNQAAQFCLQNQFHLEEALTFADAAIAAPFVGQENFTTLFTRAQVLQALGKTAEFEQAVKRATDHRSASPIQIHTAARTLQAAGNTEVAFGLFKKNHERFGDEWPVHVGMARALAGEGKFKKALVHAKKALEQAPDPLNQTNLQTVVELLEQGKDFNATN